MIASTFVVGTANANQNVTGTTSVPDGNDLEVTKKVWNGTAWVDSITAEIGETIHFNITITYHKMCKQGYELTDINVTDTINHYGFGLNHYGLAYVFHSSNFAPSYIDGNVIYWNLTKDHGVILDYDRESSVSILFNITLTNGYGTLVNHVSVDAVEHCCKVDRHGEDEACVRVPKPPSLIFEKQVWNGTGWSDVFDGVHLGEYVHFQLTITYLGTDDIDLLKCAIVKDYLPTCCLEYVNDSEEFIYPDENLFEDPNVTVSDNIVVFDWWTTDKLFNLYAGQSVVIRFSAEVVKYCYDWVENCANVHLWSCKIPRENCLFLYKEDCASINCTPPPTTFDKFVKDGKEIVFVKDNWVKEINTTIGSTLRFRLELTYYGNEYLSDIRFYDELPCILEYADNLDSNVENISNYVEVSNDSKQIWWNLTHIELQDGETIYIEFNADVIGTTGNCCECEYVVNYASVTAREGCTQEPNFFMEDTVKITATANCPPSIPQIRGPTTGKVGEELTFYFVSTDPDGDQITYTINWGNRVISIELKSSDSGEEYIKTYNYTSAGTYKITASARDTHGASSGWTPSGYEHVITITEEEEPVINLSIDINKLSFGEIKGTIKNTGDIDVSDVDWKINITGGILDKINLAANGTIDELNQGEQGCITTGKRSLKHGFGRVNVVVTAVVDGQNFTETFHGFVLGRIFIDQTGKTL